MLHLTKGGMEKYRIALPSSLDEQIAIGEVLSDADSLIRSLEAVIAKKRAIKEGVMGELLRPKEGWRETTLGEITEHSKSQFDDGDWIESEFIIKSGVRLIQTGNVGVGYFIDRENKKYISEESFKKLNCKEVLEGDLLICRLADPAGRACIMPSIGEEKVITSVDVTIVRPKSKDIDREYLCQYFCTSEWLEQVSGSSGGTTHKRISRGNLSKLQFKIPPIELQKEIAEVLTSIDAELTTLTTKLAKARQLKAGMMGDLLTGKVRLV
jgi:type I restriction enzyme S subunit